MKILSCFFLPLLLAACGSDSNNPPTTDLFRSSFSEADISAMHSYIKNSAHFQVLKHCVLITAAENSCSLKSLPLIGMEVDQPIISDIMQRVVVSHDWMGKRFQEVLTEMPREMFTLFKAVSAIVITKNIRPSYFSNITGAIYIDPANLWLTNGEKVLVGKDDDFRINFIKKLKFNLHFRNLIDNQYASTYYSLEGNEVRGLSDIVIETNSLFFHELAHANDCIPTDNMINIATDQSHYELFISQVSNNLCVFQQLQDNMPLSSEIWASLSAVVYFGENATPEQSALTAQDAGMVFSDDIAISFYSFSTLREAMADAFETLMVKKYFNVDRDLGVLVDYENYTCDDAVVAWGQRNRLTDPQVFARSLFVAEQLLPAVDFSNLQASLPTASDIPEGSSWCELSYNQITFAAQSFQKRQSKVKTIRKPPPNPLYRF